MHFNIVISGLGAIGGYYGAMLANYTHQLKTVHTHFFLRKGEHQRQIEAQGLHVVSPTLDFFAKPVTVATDIADLPVANILILATKGYSVAKNLEQLKPIINEQTLIVTTQNGLIIPEKVHKTVPHCPIAGAACHITCRKTPGLITVRSDQNLLKIGPLPTLMKRTSNKVWNSIEYLYTLMRAAGVKCKLYDDGDTVLREKFIMLSPSAVSTAYFDCNIGEVKLNHLIQLKQLVAELAKVYHAMGVKNSLFIEEEAFQAIDQMPNEATTSMHSDIKAGHTSELELLVGYVVKMAKKFNVDTPLYNEYYKALKERVLQGKISL